MNKGKKHACMGMDIELKKNGTIEVLMKEYISENIYAFGEPIDKSANITSKCNFLLQGNQQYWIH